MSKLAHDTTRKSGSVFWLALVALILSAASLFAGPFGFVPGLILANAAFYRSRQMDRYRGYSVLAAASLVVGYAFAAMYAFVYLVLPILYVLQSLLSIVLAENVRWHVKLLVMTTATVTTGMFYCVYLALKNEPTVTRYMCGALFAAFMIWACVVDSIQSFRDLARRNTCINNMRNLGTSLVEREVTHPQISVRQMDREEALRITSGENSEPVH